MGRFTVPGPPVSRAARLTISRASNPFRRRVEFAACVALRGCIKRDFAELLQSAFDWSVMPSQFTAMGRIESVVASFLQGSKKKTMDTGTRREAAAIVTKAACCKIRKNHLRHP